MTTTKVKKPRKPAATNEEVIKNLALAGFDTYANIKDKSTKYSTKWNDEYTWIPGKGSARITHFSYMIPVEVYKALGYRFAQQFTKGTQVRLRPCSTRKYERSKHNNDLGDTKDWGHLGIGSGKLYLGKRVLHLLRDAEGLAIDGLLSSDLSIRNTWQTNYARRRIKTNFNKQILIGNHRFPLNLINALERLRSYKTRGVDRKYTTLWDKNTIRTMTFSSGDLIKYGKINPQGAFEPKQLINGWIRQVYVHFIWPKWERKRESRYEVLWENGASGVFTNDYLEKCFDTDYDFDENIHLCAGKCSTCNHGRFHQETHECSEACAQSEKFSEGCTELYDMQKLMDSTTGKGLDYVSENL